MSGKEKYYRLQADVGFVITCFASLFSIILLVGAIFGRSLEIGFYALVTAILAACFFYSLSGFEAHHTNWRSNRAGKKESGKMKYLKTISQIGLLLSPLVSFLAFMNSYIPKAKFFQFSEFTPGSPEYKEMVSLARTEVFVETFPWFMPILIFLIAFVFLRKKTK